MNCRNVAKLRIAGAQAVRKTANQRGHKAKLMEEDYERHVSSAHPRRIHNSLADGGEGSGPRSFGTR